MYFTLDCARRIDGVRQRVHDWRVTGVVTDDEYYLLLAALLEGADAIANTTGIYAAYIKQWQPNALRDLRLRLPLIVTPRAHRHGRATAACEAYQGDVSRIAPTAGHFDLLYLDPPYNTRQYHAYYHVPEIIARGWFNGPLPLRGKTGLPPNGDMKSAWSTRGQCVAALAQLIESVDADHVLLSYNSEGIIPDAEIERVFRDAGRARTYARISRAYQRYRSDRPSATRRYTAHSVQENLHYVRLKNDRRSKPVLAPHGRRPLV
jgi:adenine-specific DNA-methyltransferase